MDNSRKKYCVLVVFIIVFILLFNQRYVQAVMLEDEVNGYSFEYPYDWKAAVFPDSKNLIKGEINKDNNTGAQIRIYQSTGDFRKFIDWYVDDFIQQMQKHWGGEMVISDEEFTTVAGYECFVIILDFIRRDNKRWFLKQYLWPKGPEVLILQFGTMFEMRTLNEPTIDEITKSLKFIR